MLDWRKWASKSKGNKKAVHSFRRTHLPHRKVSDQQAVFGSHGINLHLKVYITIRLVEFGLLIEKLGEKL